MPRIETIEDVVERQLCTGCGACAWAEPERYVMRDVPELGRRPLHVDNPSAPTGRALECCPGAELSHKADETNPLLLKELESRWGPVLAVHEGHATDVEIRAAASSGGLATALAVFALERLGSAGVLQTKQDPQNPILNAATFSRDRENIIASSGSRYSPASPCEALAEIQSADSPAVFVGKPCDVAAVRKASEKNDTLRDKTAFTVGFFCAGVPSTAGLLELLNHQGLSKPEQLTSLRFRGNGWPGRWVATWNEMGRETRRAELTYEESWGFLQAYRQWRCHICPDHSGEFADIAVGDPWYRPVTDSENGSSLIVVRTQRGREILEAAVKAGYVTLVRENVPNILPKSQPNLIKARGALWGRLMALRLAGIPVPNYVNFGLFRHWILDLNLIEKIQSFYGTIKRIKSKNLSSPIILYKQRPSNLPPE